MYNLVILCILSVVWGLPSSRSTSPCLSTRLAGSAAPSEVGCRVDARKLTREDFQKLYEGKVPMILTNVFDFDNDCYIEELMERMFKETIEFDIRRDKEIETYECYMEDFVGAMIESTHAASFYFMDEQMLNRVAPDRVHELRFPSRLFGKNYFNYFPSLVRPKMALIMGGLGSRSFLHADPYEWVGTNYLFEGRKLWTFIPPDKEEEEPLTENSGGGTTMWAARDPRPPDEVEQRRGYPTASHVFNFRRQSPDAWGGIFNLSAGWVSEVDLFALGDADGQSSLNQVLLDTQLYAADDGGDGEGASKAESAAPEKGLASMEDPSDAVIGSALLRGSDLGQVPLFRSGVVHVDECDRRTLEGAVQIVQEEGDMLLIPPRWWHQVYNLQPSIAVASQYMNEYSKDRVIDHMLLWNNMTRHSEYMPPGYAALSPRSQILSCLEACLCERHGKEKGLRAFRRLTSTKPIRTGSRVGSRNVKVAYVPPSIIAEEGVAMATATDRQRPSVADTRPTTIDASQRASFRKRMLKARLHKQSKKS